MKSGPIFGEYSSSLGQRVSFGGDFINLRVSRVPVELGVNGAASRGHFFVSLLGTEKFQRNRSKNPISTLGELISN